VDLPTFGFPTSPIFSPTAPPTAGPA
jgi:hypothetical protein